MRYSTFILPALLGAATALQAHDIPWPGAESFKDWWLVTETPRGSVFIADVQRVGRAASFLSMAVYKTPLKDERFPDSYDFDAETEAVLVDCETKQHELDEPNRTRAGMQLPPPLIRTLIPDGADPEMANDRAPPPAGPRLYQLQIACGETSLPDQAVEDPYRWARQRWGLKTPPLRRRR